MAEPAVPARKLTVSDFTKSVESKVNERIQGTAPLDNAPLGNQDVDAVWKKIFDVAEKYDNGMCESYNDHIDIVLVFAGLFSAVVTAFTVESYKWLHDDSGDATVQLLARIAGTSPPSTSALSDSQAVRINAYWFLALLLSLSSAFVAILARQWILEFQRRYRQSHRDGLAVRQAKLVGLESWHLERYASTYPLMLLQVSLVLFVTGILELLWTLSNRVAVPAIVVSIILAAMYVVTTILPCIQLAYASWTGMPTHKLNPYQSPQAWILLSLFAKIMNHCAQLRQSRLLSVFLHPLRTLRGQAAPSAMRNVQALWNTKSWIDYGFQWTVLGDSGLGMPDSPSRGRVDYAFDAIAWLQSRLSGSELAEPVWHCVWAHVATLGPSKATISAKQSIAQRMGFLNPRFECDKYDPELQPWVLLLDLADAKGVQPVLIFELLYLAQQASLQIAERPEPTQSRTRLEPELMLQLIRASEGRLSSKRIDEETCRHLLATVSEPSVWGDSHQFVEATGVALRVLGLTVSIPPDGRRGLVEDVCGMLRRWLVQLHESHSESANAIEDIPGNVFDLLDSTTPVMLRVIRMLEIDVSEAAVLKADSDGTRAAAGLASAAAALSKELFLLMAWLRSEDNVRPALERLIEIGATVPAAAPRSVERPALPAAGGQDARAAGTEAPSHTTQTSRDGSHGHGEGAGAAASPGEGSTAAPREHGSSGPTGGSVPELPQLKTGGLGPDSASTGASAPEASSLVVPACMDTEAGAVDSSPARAAHRSLLGNVPEPDIERGEQANSTMTE